jgi:glycosyltransferase involved in cell wall biosynthesis
MACGCPAIATRTGWLPEVVSEAGVLLPADDAAAWKGLCCARAEQNLDRAARFSWEDCARKTLAAYERAL